MRRVTLALLAMVLLTAGAPSPARADGFGWGLLFGTLIAAPIVASTYYPRYYYPPYYGYTPYYPYGPTYGYAEPTYAAPRVSPEASQVWYYCASSRGYYPYTRACPEGWQTVPVRPPGM